MQSCQLRFLMKDLHVEPTPRTQNAEQCGDRNRILGTSLKRLDQATPEGLPLGDSNTGAK